jgi:hypothetical protein
LQVGKMVRQNDSTESTKLGEYNKFTILH